MNAVIHFFQHNAGLSIAIVVLIILFANGTIERIFKAIRDRF